LPGQRWKIGRYHLWPWKRALSGSFVPARDTFRLPDNWQITDLLT
jgi:hypothetical protein